MSKQYGLIIPNKQKSHEPPKSDFKRPSIFGNSSDSDEDKPPQPSKVRTAPIGPGAVEKRFAKKLQEKALEEDPTIFQYDELYDEIENKRKEEKTVQNTEDKKPKYIGRLLECAQRRKLENERRIERMVQKEREEEGDEFRDKESFVTSAYRKKLEDMQKAEEQEKREEYLESIGDVTKQKDLDGFYRHLYEQKLGPKEGKKPVPEAPTSTSKESEEVSYKPIKSGKSRAYRKRRSSGEDDQDDGKPATEPAKRAHIQSNLDADSDFSIDSSSDEEDNTNSKKDDSNKANEDRDKIKENQIEIHIKKEPDDGDEKKDPVASEVPVVQPSEVVKKEETIDEDKPNMDIPPPPQPKKDLSLIWKKRTVGEVFDAALQRYFQRKAARSG